ncbi:SDR family oxidoreductase [Chitinispirillales bacterium ANBcel5]|uniref:SDR family oxidoreductase n=1 Tax=Cellulosispirillum alkaliphilum TaxID=3039283 RepID=UPI002A546783|nr:SDR family oxidoreductase [Chitinispirillales bacterium ANBcel5]
MKDPTVVVITGASAGVGRATAIKFAKRNAKIALLARGTQGLEGARRDVVANGGEALVIPVDVADHTAIENAAEAITDTWGKIDIWINCAMTTILAEFSDITPQEFRRVTEVTYLGYVYGTMSALKRMMPLNRGKIVQVGSSLCYRGIPLQSAYCGAKHAIKGFTESIRSELMHNKCKITISMVHLPAINTPQFLWSKNKMPRKHQPVPPIYQPELCADAVVWAATHKKREILVGFSTVKVLSLNKVFPGIIDIYLAKKGYDSQQYNGINEHKEDNLWNPVDKDYGSRGVFNEDSRTKDLLLQLSKLHALKLSIGALFTLMLLFSCRKK